MAVDKLVDSSQLDADLTSVANAIRTKGGTSAQLAFPADFVSAVQAIPTGTTPTGTKQISITQNGTITEDVAAYANAEITVNVSGGGGDIDALIDGSITSITSNVTSIRNSGLQNASNLVSASFPLCTRINGIGALQGCTKLETLSIPICTYIGASTTNLDTKLTSLNAYNVVEVASMGLKSIRVVALCLPHLTTVANSAFEGNTAMTHFDVGPLTAIQNFAFNGNSSLNTLILRKTSITALSDIRAFNNTPFASGGTGGTIYIPKALYDHLGDGTSSDYQAATNWATLHGYGTITWAKIEGSIYETQYADGTTIPTS